MAVWQVERTINVRQRAMVAAPADAEEASVVDKAYAQGWRDIDQQEVGDWPDVMMIRE